jgi:hypothetical protein
LSTVLLSFSLLILSVWGFSACSTCLLSVTYVFHCCCWLVTLRSQSPISWLPELNFQLFAGYYLLLKPLFSLIQPCFFPVFPTSLFTIISCHVPSHSPSSYSLGCQTIAMKSLFLFSYAPLAIALI